MDPLNKTLYEVNNDTLETMSKIPVPSKKSVFNTKNIFTSKNITFAVVALSAAVGIRNLMAGALWPSIQSMPNPPKFRLILLPNQTHTLQCFATDIPINELNFNPFTCNSTHLPYTQTQPLAELADPKTPPQPFPPPSVISNAMRCDLAWKWAIKTDLTFSLWIVNQGAAFGSDESLLLGNTIPNTTHSPGIPFSHLDKVQTLFNETQANINVNATQLNSTSCLNNTMQRGANSSNLNATNITSPPAPHITSLHQLSWDAIAFPISPSGENRAVDSWKIRSTSEEGLLSQTVGVLSKGINLPKFITGKVIETVGEIVKYCVTEEGKYYCALVATLAAIKHSEKAPINVMRTILKKSFKPLNSNILKDTLLASNARSQLIVRRHESGLYNDGILRLLRPNVGPLALYDSIDWMRIASMRTSLSSPLQSEGWMRKLLQAQLDAQLHQINNKKPTMQLGLTWDRVNEKKFNSLEINPGLGTKNVADPSVFASLYTIPPPPLAPKKTPQWKLESSCVKILTRGEPAINIGSFKKMLSALPEGAFRDAVIDAGNEDKKIFSIRVGISHPDLSYIWMPDRAALQVMALKFHQKYGVLIRETTVDNLQSLLNEIDDTIEGPQSIGIIVSMESDSEYVHALPLIIYLEKKDSTGQRALEILIADTLGRSHLLYYRTKYRVNEFVKKYNYAKIYSSTGIRQFDTFSCRIGAIMFLKRALMALQRSPDNLDEHASEGGLENYLKKHATFNEEDDFLVDHLPPTFDASEQISNKRADRDTTLDSRHRTNKKPITIGQLRQRHQEEVPVVYEFSINSFTLPPSLPENVEVIEGINPTIIVTGKMSINTHLLRTAYKYRELHFKK